MVGRMTWTCQFHSLKSNGVKYGVHKLIQPIMLGAQQPWPINIEWWQRGTRGVGLYSEFTSPR